MPYVFEVQAPRNDVKGLRGACGLLTEAKSPQPRVLGPPLHFRSAVPRVLGLSDCEERVNCHPLASTAAALSLWFLVVLARWHGPCLKRMRE
jgi:hypothetical protein